MNWRAQPLLRPISRISGESLGPVILVYGVRVYLETGWMIPKPWLRLHALKSSLGMRLGGVNSDEHYRFTSKFKLVNVPEQRHMHR
jgi:hypothetical protein